MLASNFFYCRPAFGRLAAKAGNRHAALWKRKLDRSFEPQRRIQVGLRINNWCFGCHFLVLLLHGHDATIWLAQRAKRPIIIPSPMAASSNRFPTRVYAPRANNFH